MSRNKTSVRLSVSQSVLREGLRLLIESQPDLKVRGSGPSNLLIIDLSDDGSLERLRSLGGTTKVVALCENAEVEALDVILGTGARAVVVKTAHPSSLLQAVRFVSRGHKWLDPEIQSRLMNPDSLAPDQESRWQTLTKREREVATLVLAGNRYRDVASELTISEHTVRNHLRSVFAKLGIASRVELAPYEAQAAETSP